MPILSGCCFCLDLKVGTKIIGALNLIGGLTNSLMFAILVVVLVFIDPGEQKQNIRPTPDPTELEDEDYMDVLQEQGVNIYEMFMTHFNLMKIVVYVLLAVSLLLVITSSMLIHGVRRNRQGLLLPFIVQESFNLLIFAALAIIALVLFGGSMVIVSSVISVVVSILIHLYFLLVVVSQYQALGLIRMHEEISMK